MEIHQVHNFLNQVKAITTRYKKISELTGENFNVFRILKLESSEVRMHSAFLAELLNPHGSHGQKDVFLKLFIKDFCFKDNLIDTSSCKVKVEDNIGLISIDKMQGGRMDIVITDKYNNQIIVENKIYAVDQAYQLTRYYNYSNNADIIYLTLDGKDAEKYSKGELIDGAHYKRYSYKDDILEWLESCRKEVAIYPIVREAITHYINLIKYLTNQTLNKSMQEELSELLKSDIEASFAIANNLNKACEKIAEEFCQEIMLECEKIGLSCFNHLDFDKRYNGIFIADPRWKYVNIGFQFQSYDEQLRYGIITKKNPSESPIPVKVKNAINSLINNTPKINDWWPWYKSFEQPHDNWSKYHSWQAILDHRMKTSFLEKINDILEMTKNLEM